MEVVGAVLYLLNKIFFLLREIAGSKGDQDAVTFWKISAWIAGLTGLPFVTYVLISERDWIFGWLELGVAPSMFVGLILAYSGSKKKVPVFVDRVVYVAIAVGLVCSLWDFGGLTETTQLLEMVAVVSFWLGSWQLAKDSPNGYLTYLPMFAAAGSLLYLQEHYWFARQQIASAIIVFAAYILARNRKD